MRAGELNQDCLLVETSGALDGGAPQPNPRIERSEFNPEFLPKIEAFCRAQIRGTVPNAEERDCWDALFLSYGPATRRIAQKVGLHGGDVDDCVQDAWIEIFVELAAGGYDPQRGRLFSWIFTLVRNKAIDLLRTARPRALIEQSNLDLFPSNRELDPAEAFERKRSDLLLHNALDELFRRLSPATFQTLYGFWIEGKNCEQMARELSLTLEQVRYRRRRAKQSLLKLLKHWPEWAEPHKIR